MIVTKVVTDPAPVTLAPTTQRAATPVYSPPAQRTYTPAPVQAAPVQAPGARTRSSAGRHVRVVRAMWHTQSAPMMGTTLTLVAGAEGLTEAQVRSRFTAVLDDLAGLASVWTRFDPDSGWSG